MVETMATLNFAMAGSSLAGTLDRSEHCIRLRMDVRNQFNSAKNAVRVLLLLSPT
jgi:hypothetical protein